MPETIMKNKVQEAHSTNLQALKEVQMKLPGEKYNILTILRSIAFVVIPIYQHLSTLKLYH